MASGAEGPPPRIEWVGGDSTPLGTPTRIDEDGCPLTAVSPRAQSPVPCDINVGEKTWSSDGCGATSSGGLLLGLADELQSLLFAKLQAKELLSLAKTCKRAREVIMEGLISDTIWEQLLVNDFPCVASDLAALVDAAGPCAPLREADGQGEEVETFSNFISTPEAPTLDPNDLAMPPGCPDTPQPASTSPTWFELYRVAATSIGNFSSVTWHLANVKREAVAGRRQGAGSTVMNGKLYVFGGWMSSNRISNDVVCLSQAPDRRLVWNWISTTQGERPQPVYGCTISAVTSQTHGQCLVTHGGVIWGGYQGAVNDVHILKSRSPGEEPSIWVCPDEAHELAPPMPRAYHTATFVPSPRNNPGTGGLYIFGGFSNGRARAHLEVLNVDEEVARWSRPLICGREPPPRFGHSCTHLPDMLVIAGGCSGGHNHKGRGTVGHELQDVHILHLGDEIPRWSELNLKAPVPERCMQRCHSAVVMGKRIILFGGGPSYDLSSNIDVLDPYKGTIERPKVSGFEPQPRQGAVVGVPFGPGKMAVWGGWNGMELGDMFILTVDSWNAGDSQAMQNEGVVGSTTSMWISPYSVRGLFTMLSNSTQQSRVQTALVILFIVSVGSFASSTSWMR